VTALHVFDMDGTLSTVTVAVNADEHLAGPAAVSYRGDDLTEAYAPGRARLA
jgi:hypothetical protein